MSERDAIAEMMLMKTLHPEIESWKEAVPPESSAPQ